MRVLQISSLATDGTIVVSHAARVFVYEGLANGTENGRADYASVAPFFLNETFPNNWYRRGDPFTLPAAFEVGGNEGLNNFIPLDVDLGSKTPAQLGCFILENFLDLAPGQIQPTVVNNLDLFTGFVKGIVAPFFINDGYFNCDVTNFVKPSASAGVDQSGSESSSGSPVDGAYPGIGVIEPDSQPS